MYLNDHACFAKKMNATMKTNVSCTEDLKL